ncbi:MAG: DUF1015 domain-containing protein [Ruminococcaceae bacterium]|nr:DUF1015 domain-containing protein [Oscillospiraceae bacterium]
MKKAYSPADILLPDFNKIDASKWAVIACDQFTSEPHYWENAERIVGDAPSTLRIMLPEVYLSETAERIPTINATMDTYLCEHLVSHPNSMIYVERTQSDGNVRRGIVMAIDLECYDFKKGANALIRATEATVIERIPPRVAIRRDAKIELPHVMLLIDDPKRTVIESLSSENCPIVAYDTELMLGGGHVKGRFLSDEAKRTVSAALDTLITPEAMAERYGDSSLAPLLFAVGDGNHSLATAKTIYEEIKASIGEEAAASHPARYALTEVVNIHDEALKFEPIYRVMFNVDPDDVLTKLTAYTEALSGSAQSQTIEYLTDKKNGNIVVAAPEKQLTVGTLQDFIDGYIKENPKAEVDYIHGVESVKSLIGKSSIGFIFSGMSKSELFKTVIYDGALPRKTFSMGHAEDKRYYLECRSITK